MECSLADIDTDLLLQKDLVTLDEAVRTANNAVLLAINAISILTSVSFPFWFIVSLLELVILSFIFYLLVYSGCPQKAFGLDAEQYERTEYY